MLESFFNKCNFIKKETPIKLLFYEISPKFLRTSVMKNICKRLLLFMPPYFYLLGHVLFKQSKLDLNTTAFPVNYFLRVGRITTFSGELFPQARPNFTKSFELLLG